MFSVEQRLALRQAIIERAKSDHEIDACALLGSAARGEEDTWSDIDLALQLVQGCELEPVAERWATWLSTIADVADTLTVHASGALYRVFLLSNSTQLDLSFWPSGTLRSTGGPIHAFFGSVGEAERAATDPESFIRMGWLYALHTRSAIARARSWQADMMLAGLRDQIIALACHRLGYNPQDGRDAHRLPAELSARLLAARARNLESSEQARSLHETLTLYREETQHHREISRSFDQALNALRSPTS